MPSPVEPGHRSAAQQERHRDATIPDEHLYRADHDEHDEFGLHNPHLREDHRGGGGGGGDREHHRDATTVAAPRPRRPSHPTVIPISGPTDIIFALRPTPPPPNGTPTILLPSGTVPVAVAKRTQCLALGSRAPEPPNRRHEAEHHQKGEDEDDDAESV